MISSSKRTASLLRRIHEFLQRQPVSVALGDLKLPIESLEAQIKALEANDVDSDRHIRAAVAATGKIRALTREARQSYLRPVARAARVVFKQNPELRESLKVRAPLRRPEMVMDALRSTADAAAPYKAELAKAGFAEDFTQRMRALADALKQAIDERAKERGFRAGASTGKWEAADDGRAIVRLIDSMVAFPLSSNPPLLAQWKSLLRQERVRPPEKEETTGTPAPTPTPSPALPIPSGTSGGAPKSTSADKAA